MLTQDEAIELRMEVLKRTHAAELAALEKATIERCAKAAHSFANTKANVEASDDEHTANAIAAIMSETGLRIETAIRALPREHKEPNK